MKKRIRETKAKISLKKVAKVYLLVFAFLMVIYCSVNVPAPTGEWDDYSLPIASILHSGKFTVASDDIVAYKQIYPKWAELIDNYSLSRYLTKDGSREYTWYFPTYAIVCIPYTLVLQILELPTEYAFTYTNLTVLMIALVVVFKYLQTDEKKKLLLTILLSVNPIVFYLGWISAEVFIYAMLVIALVAWYNKWYKRAALFVSIAGMLNPTIMVIGIVMILEYLYNLYTEKPRKIKWMPYIKKNIDNILDYGCCYIVGIIPMIYNYVNTGHINLTASIGEYTKGKESTIARFFSYLFDLNYGLLPYYVVVVIIAPILLGLAIKEKHFRYIQWFITFLITALLYSVMTQINTGMSGIARYNVWGVLLLLFAIYLFGDEIIRAPKIKKVPDCFLTGGIVVTGIVVLSYGPFLALNTSCISLTPIAEWALDNAPMFYNPLHSTYNCRVTNTDGGYIYDTPIVYTSEDGYVTKILASAKDKEELKANYITTQKNEEWLAKQIDRLGDSEQYLSIPKSRQVIQLYPYNLGTNISFKAKNYNAENYVVKGLNGKEEWGTWTEGNEFVMRFKINSSCELIHGVINYSVYNNTQDVCIYVNDEVVYSAIRCRGGAINFDFKNPGVDQMIEIKIELPDAISPKELGYSDERVLGLGLSDMLFWGV